MTEGSFQSKFDYNAYVDIGIPVIFIARDGFLSLNDVLIEQINGRKLTHHLWIDSEAMEDLAHRWAAEMGPISGQWSDPRQPDIGRVSIEWAQRKPDPDYPDPNPKGGFKIGIEGYNNFVWMIDHDKPENFRRDLNIWRGQWPD